MKKFKNKASHRQKVHHIHIEIFVNLQPEEIHFYSDSTKKLTTQPSHYFWDIDISSSVHTKSSALTFELGSVRYSPTILVRCSIPSFWGCWKKNLIIGMKACQHFLMSSETIPTAAFWIEGIKLGVWLWQFGQNSFQLRFDVYKNRTDSLHKSFSLIPASVRAIFVNSWIKRLYCTSSSSTILNLNPRTVIPFSWVSASCTVSSWMFRWTKCNSSGYLATVTFTQCRMGYELSYF